VTAGNVSTDCSGICGLSCAADRNGRRSSASVLTRTDYALPSMAPQGGKGWSLRLRFARHGAPGRQRLEPSLTLCVHGTPREAKAGAFAYALASMAPPGRQRLEPSLTLCVHGAPRGSALGFRGTGLRRFGGMQKSFAIGDSLRLLCFTETLSVLSIDAAARQSVFAKLRRDR
jgi:hypothetical protein